MWVQVWVWGREWGWVWAYLGGKGGWGTALWAGTYWKRGGGGGGGWPDTPSSHGHPHPGAFAFFVSSNPLAPKARKETLPPTVEGEEGGRFGLVWSAPDPCPHRLKVSEGLRHGMQRSSIPGYLSPLVRHTGSDHAAIRSPRVWYAPEIDPAISRLLFSCGRGGGLRGSGGGSMVDRLNAPAIDTFSH